MLNKVRARHGVDLPVERWKKGFGIGGALAILAILFILLPALVVVLNGLVERPMLTAIGIASGLVTLLVASLFVRV